MKKYLNTILFILTLVFFSSGVESCKKKGVYNKYRQAKVRPSEKQTRADKKILARSNKNYKKQMLTNRKRLFGSKRDPHGPKN